MENSTSATMITDNPITPYPKAMEEPTRLSNKYSDLFAVKSNLDQNEISSLSLLLDAMKIRHFIDHNEQGYLLLVSHTDAKRAAREILLYEQENQNWPPQAPGGCEDTGGSSPALLLMSILFLFYLVTGPWSEGAGWFARGAGDAVAIREKGEYFRLITALTLHADLAHVLGNCLLGGVVLHFLIRLTGTGIGIFAIFLTAGTGNLLNVSFRHSEHLFVGFSTAIFAIIGMLVFLSAGKDTARPSSLLKQAFLPFLAALGLLAMLGTSGERTDLGAHLFGLLAGLPAGAVLASRPARGARHHVALQSFFFMITLTTVLLCWYFAFCHSI